MVIGVAFLLQLQRDANESGGEVDAGDVVERPRELERRAADGAAQIEGFPPRAVFRVLNADFGRADAEIGHAVVRRAVMGLTILRYSCVGLVHRLRLGQRLLGFNIPQAGVLEEVPAEGIAHVARRLVAGGVPGTAFDQVMPRVESGRGEIIVIRMNLKTFEAVNRRLGPLPNVADEIVKLAEAELVHRARRGPMLQVDIARRFRPVRLVGNLMQVVQPPPLGLGGKADRAAGLCRHPVAKRLRFKLIHFDGPVPRHVDDLGHRAQFMVRSSPLRRRSVSISAEAGTANVGTSIQKRGCSAREKSSHLRPSSVQ